MLPVASIHSLCAILRKPEKLRNLIIIFTFILSSCDDTLPKTGQKLTQAILWRTERFLPTNFGYNLLEVAQDSGTESLRFLYLFDHNNNFIDGIQLYGMVQNIEKDKIEINPSASGWTGDSTIGNLKVQYVDNKEVGYGGGTEGDFIMDSLKYDRKMKNVTLYFKKSKEWFSSEDCSHTEKMTTQIQNIEFNPEYVGDFEIAKSELVVKKGIWSHTKYFTTRDKKQLTIFFEDIEKNGL